jgi:glycosyltransferase involved in cell wall biosynthesis
VAEIPAPYRVGLYRRLREEVGIDLKLLFCSTTQADRDWTVSLEGVPHVVMRGRTLRVRPREQFFLRINPQVWRELDRFNPHAVVVGGYAHVTMQLAMLWCRRTGTPYLINSESHRQGTEQSGKGRGRWPGSVAAMGRSLVNAVKRFFIRGAAAGLPAGTLARDCLVSYGGPAERMFALPNTCDVERFARESERARNRRAELRTELGLGSGPVVLYVGRLAPVKGLDTLLQAFGHSGVQGAGSERPNASPQLLLVGDGEQREQLEALAGALGLRERVCFAGPRPWGELPSLYGLADLFVLPSTFEPWGAVVNEALACGLPVIASDQVGCAPDLVRPGENGWIVPAGDADALGEALREALADPERLRAMAAASSRLAPSWGEDACLTSFVTAIQAVTGSLRTVGGSTNSPLE